jgi:ParB family chromosome partitioning protein
MKGICVSTSLLQIPVNELMADPNQPRQGWVQSEIDRLATSIAARGVLQPLRVVRDNER